MHWGISEASTHEEILELSRKVTVDNFVHLIPAKTEHFFFLRVFFRVDADIVNRSVLIANVFCSKKEREKSNVCIT